MSTQTRSCAWMAGPKNASLHISAARWWLAVSRGMLARGCGEPAHLSRSPALCVQTPRFSSPLRRKV